ncbi:MAG: hypothetical protein JWN82_96 [Candidatus Saccharibacteria bacterium]|nr:hypothetical protein [Candidatus Saccharibacteria bacterium]
MTGEKLRNWTPDDPANLQPKLQIGNYVESAGFAVPLRFETFDDALDSVRHGGAIIVRSESPYDYSGPSGLLSSHVISSESIVAGKRLQSFFPSLPDEQGLVMGEAAILPFRGTDKAGAGIHDLQEIIIGKSLERQPAETLKLLSRLNLHEPAAKRYMEVTQDRRLLDSAESCFSFWEYIPGTNVTLVADDVMSNNYHLVGSNRIDLQQFGAIVNGEGSVKRYTSLAPLLANQHALEDMVRVYEGIRELPPFTPGDCPLMELQVDAKGHIWFLQYHKGRQYRPAPAELSEDDYPTSEGWIRLDAVRGAIGALTTVKAAVSYPPGYGTGRFSPLPLTEEASLGFKHDSGLHEALAHRRTAYVSGRGFAGVYDGMSNGHELASQWFKPQVSVAYDATRHNIIPAPLHNAMAEITARGDHMARVALDLATDGREGFLRLNPDIEQPIISDV